MYTAIKLVLSLLLMLCLLEMPYGFFQLVRFFALIGFSILAIHENSEGRRIETIFFIALAILFQPLLKISLGREIWNIVDVIVAIGLIGSIFIKTDLNKHPNSKP
jgi:hypothetical protein